MAPCRADDRRIPLSTNSHPILMPEQIAIPQAKWPNKVLRYKITCPIQRMLVVKYEGQIDWDGRRHGQRIESGKALDAHVREVMLPAIRSLRTMVFPCLRYTCWKMICLGFWPLGQLNPVCPLTVNVSVPHTKWRRPLWSAVRTSKGP